MKAILKTIGIVLLAASVSACYGDDSIYTGSAQMKRNEVKLVRYSHDITLPAQGSELSREAEARLYQFLGLVNVGYGDKISVDTGTAGSRAPEAVQSFLSRHGLWIDAKAPIIGAAPAPGTARLIIERHVVIPPQCGTWTEAPNPDHGTAPSSDFGCSTQTILGLMVADPEDLILANQDTWATGESAIRGVMVGRMQVGNGPSIGMSLTGDIGSLFGN